MFSKMQQNPYTFCTPYIAMGSYLLLGPGKHDKYESNINEKIKTIVVYFSCLLCKRLLKFYPPQPTKRTFRTAIKHLMRINPAHRQPNPAKALFSLAADVLPGFVLSVFSVAARIGASSAVQLQPVDAVILLSVSQARGGTPAVR